MVVMMMIVMMVLVTAGFSQNNLLKQILTLGGAGEAKTIIPPSYQPLP